MKARQKLFITFSYSFLVELLKNIGMLLSILSLFVSEPIDTETGDTKCAFVQLSLQQAQSDLKEEVESANGQTVRETNQQ